MVSSDYVILVADNSWWQTKGVIGYLFDKAKIKASFSRHADSYDRAANLQQEVGLKLISQLTPTGRQLRVLDIGMGTGFLARKLCRNNPSFKIFGCDIAHGMNLYAQKQLAHIPRQVYPLTADAEYLCYKAQQVDLVISNLSYQWLNDIKQALREAMRVLKPGGRLMFTTMGEQTLLELRDCFNRAYSEQKGQIPSYTHNFIKQAELLLMMKDVGFSRMRVESQLYYRAYQEISDLFKSLKQLGAINASVNRPRGLVGKAIINRLKQLYLENYSVAGQLKAGYEVLFAGGEKED